MTLAHKVWDWRFGVYGLVVSEYIKLEIPYAAIFSSDLMLFAFLHKRLLTAWTAHHFSG